MKVALDTSALAKRYVEEPGSAAVEAVLQQASLLGLCVLCIPEIISALNRRRRKGSLSQPQYEQIKVALAADVTDAVILNVTPEVIEASTRLLESSVLRAMDALHIACAMAWHADLFVTADGRQLAAARAAGLHVQAV